VKKVLNVGGNDRRIPLPPHYQGWENHLLDIDPRGKPDLLCDARELVKTPAAQYESVYCSHNLEHYYRHDAVKVLRGFRHVLKPGGFIDVRVPDIAEVLRTVVGKGMEIDDVLYQSPAGPITAHDVIYGWGLEIERSGQDFFAHKRGFTPKSLLKTLNDNGFPYVFMGTGNLEIVAYAFPEEPNREACALLGLSYG
jgi:hypothetical protein